MKNPIKFINQNFLIRKETELMQGLIFNRVCLIILVAIPFSLIINLFTKIPYVSGGLLSGFVVTAFLYYNSRVLGNLQSSVFIFAVGLHVLLILNYYFNSGVEGPSLMLFLVSLIFIIAVMPNRHYAFWVPLNLLIAGTLIGIDYAYPNLVANSYHSRRGLFTDTGFTYGVAAACISIVLSFILRSYQKERNKALLAVNELAEANETKTKLISILSHDLKAPLNSIENFLEVLASYELNEEEKADIQTKLLTETKNTQNMLGNMLFWTKAQMEGRIEPKLIAINLLETLKVSIALQQVAAGEKNIKLKTDIDPSLSIYADVEMIKLVIRNLLNNAVKFTNADGLIILSGKAQGAVALITVKDNGIGISKEKQQTLFSLNSGPTYGTKNEKGVGLGLKLCKEFTELQGGKISFSSSPSGTIFTVAIPLRKRPVTHVVVTDSEAEIQVYA